MIQFDHFAQIAGLEWGGAASPEIVEAMVVVKVSAVSWLAVLAGVAQMSAWGASVAQDSIRRRVALGVYRPEFPDDMGAADQYERGSGSRLTIVHWYALWAGWKSAFSQSDLEAASGRGSLPMITWEPWAGQPGDPSWTLRDAILSGRSDEYIESWARGLAGYGQPVLFRFAHEMHHKSYPWAVGVNGNTAEEYVAAWRHVFAHEMHHKSYPWAVGVNGNTAEEYVAAWRHVRSIFARYNTPNVMWIWNPNVTGHDSAASYVSLYRSLYPGDDEVDWIGLDVFNTGPNLDWGAPSWWSFAEILSKPYAAITSVSNKPLILPEVGCAETGGSKAAWVTDALTVQVPYRFPRIRAMVWFDVVKEEQGALHSGSEVLEAWTIAASSPVFETDIASPPGQPE